MSQANASGVFPARSAAPLQPRALVVEDDAAIRGLIVRVLARDGFSVAEATDGREALAVLTDSSSFQVIVLDLAMPLLDGLEVIGHLSRHRPESLKRIVVVTANARALHTQLPEGVCHVLLKPFDLEEFRAAVRACARTAHA